MAGSTGDAAAQRARARAVNNGRGSSGAYQRILNMERKDFEREVEPIAEHICDMQGVIIGGSITQVGMTVQLAVPMPYVHDATEAAIASKAGTVFVRVYLIEQPADEE